MNREQRRKAERNASKAERNASPEEKDLANKVALFGKMPDECLTCLEPFDKKNKEMVTTWNVVVHGPEEVVRLYCPECWDKAVKITQDFKKHLEEKYGSSEE
tara:strand:- start:205 stop:510 length:306 start_codon:yes stop_codon:yes gene_type:complete